MSQFLKKIVQINFFIFLLYLLLTKPSWTLKYAAQGLFVWYQSMVPSLFPIMILTGCMIKLNITASFSKLIHPVTKVLFHTSPNGSYALFMGFLCGFPMGAKIICELYTQHKLSKKEAQSLLPVCNNIGPVFMLTYALPLLNVPHIYTTLILFYCIPLIYAFFMLRKKTFSGITTSQTIVYPFVTALDESITESAIGMLSLGGYLMFFNILLLIPTKILNLNRQMKSLLSCLIEITNGLSCNVIFPPYVYLALLQFGGFCCIFQTLKYTLKTDLSFKKYLVHKIILSGITFFFFFLQYVVVSYVCCV